MALFNCPFYLQFFYMLNTLLITILKNHCIDFFTALIYYKRVQSLHSKTLHWKFNYKLKDWFIE